MLTRRPLNLAHPKLKEVICNFDRLDEVQEFFNVNDVFCCLGTTIKKAKTKKAMYKVDVEYPIAIAKLAIGYAAKHFLIISSMSANKNSFLWYPKMKGILEDELKSLSFETISIFRPSLLLGDRIEYRLGEKVAGKLYHWLSPLIPHSWKSRLAIEAHTVAKAMFLAAKYNKKGINIYESRAIEEIMKI